MLFLGVRILRDERRKPIFKRIIMKEVPKEVLFCKKISEDILDILKRKLGFERITPYYIDVALPKEPPRARVPERYEGLDIIVTSEVYFFSITGEIERGTEVILTISLPKEFSGVWVEDGIIFLERDRRSYISLVGPILIDTRIYGSHRSGNSFQTVIGIGVTEGLRILSSVSTLR